MGYRSAGCGRCKSHHVYGQYPFNTTQAGSDFGHMWMLD